MDMKRFDMFAIALTKSQKDFTRIMKNAMQEEDLKHIDAICIRTIAYIDGGVSASELCKMCFYDKALISRTLSELSAKGYITRNPEDEKLSRGYRYILTDEGKHIELKMNKFVSSLAESLTRGITDEEEDMCFKTAVKIFKNMQDLSKNYSDKGRQGKNC